MLKKSGIESSSSDKANTMPPWLARLLFPSHVLCIIVLGKNHEVYYSIDKKWAIHTRRSTGSGKPEILSQVSQFKNLNYGEIYLDIPMDRGGINSEEA